MRSHRTISNDGDLMGDVSYTRQSRLFPIRILYPSQKKKNNTTTITLSTQRVPVLQPATSCIDFARVILKSKSVWWHISATRCNIAIMIIHDIYN